MARQLELDARQCFDDETKQLDRRPVRKRLDRGTVEIGESERHAFTEVARNILGRHVFGQDREHKCSTELALSSQSPFELLSYPRRPERCPVQKHDEKI